MLNAPTPAEAGRRAQKVVRQILIIAQATRIVTGGAKKLLKPRRFCSFPADTPVLMCDGTLMPIQEVQAGDWVVSQDPETGAMGCQQVVDPYANPDRGIIAVELWRADGTMELLETTDNHPFYVEGRGWTRTDELLAGDRIPAADGGILTVGHVGWTGAQTVVFNFGVTQYHTYFVGESGAWVHNCRKLKLTEAREVAQRLGFKGKNAVHEMKDEFGATSKHDLFVTDQGDVVIKPKDGSGPGEPVGINLYD